MNIHERYENQQEHLHILLEKIYLYLRYGEIEKAFDVLDESINENKNHYEYLVEKIKLLYMLYLKDEAYEVLDANIELLYANIDKIDVDFISRRIYYHFYRNIEIDNSSTANNFDYLKITKEFINKYGFIEVDKKETFLQKKNIEVASLNEDKIDVVEDLSATGEYNLFGEAITIEDEIDNFEVVIENENSEYWKTETEDNEPNIFEELFDEEVVVEEPRQEVFSEKANDDENLQEEFRYEAEEYVEAEEDVEVIFAEECTQETADETTNEELIEEIVEEKISYAEELQPEYAPEQEDIEDNPHIDEPIYLGKVNGNDIFFESMVEHVALEKEEQPIIIIDSAQYTFTRLISLLALGFVIGAAIVYYL